MKRLSISLALLGLVSLTAAAQSSAGPRWAAYAGCWEPASIDGQDAPAINPRVCVVPTGDLGADLVSITAGKITDRSHVEVDGARRQVSSKGCSGWESASFSPNGRRIYFESEQACEYNVHRKTSGLFAVGTNGQWTNVVDVSAGGAHSVRAIHYAPTHVDSTFPPEIVTAIGDREQSIATGRIAARSSITINEVIDASKTLSPGVIEAWIASDPQRFDLDAKTLVRMADSGVKPSTIDVMVAVSNPNVFHVSPTGATTELQPLDYAKNQRAHTTYDDCFGSHVDPWGRYDYGYGMCSPYYGYMGYSPFYYGRGYDSYYNGGYYYGGSPVVVIYNNGSGGSNLNQRHGKMTKDGYTTSSSSGSSATADRAQSARQGSSATSGASTSSSSGGSSGSSSSGGSSGSSTGRTAVAKPPAL